MSTKINNVMSEVFDRLKKRMTPEYRESLNKKRIEELQKVTAEYQFGYYVGEDIVNRQLPTLNVECTTNTVFNVSEEDEIEYKRLESEWYLKHQHGKDPAKKEWELYQDFRKTIIKKYLPNPLKCYQSPLNIQNPAEFKDGLISSLWSSDRCYYNLDPEKIKIYIDDQVLFTIIEFELR